MTSIERMTNILSHKPVDRIGLYEHYWSDTRKTWAAQGHLAENEDVASHFGYDMNECWGFNLVGDLDFVPQIIQETEDTVTSKDGNGAILKRHKLHDTTPEHIGFTVVDRETWEPFKKLLTPDRRRIKFAEYAAAKKRCREQNRFFVWSGIAPFEMIHPVCGHENFLVGMALDPEWVKDMANTYTELTLALMEELFSAEGKPDGIWFYEDMGYKQHPFMSPAMYRELIQPYHKRLIDYAHGIGCKVIMHSCGFVEPLLPGMVEAGIDCLQVIEVKAGMDLLRIYNNFGDRIALMGGIDVRALYSNDLSVINAELESKIPIVKGRNGFVLHSDHSIPKTVDYDSYRYFIKRGLELGTY